MKDANEKIRKNYGNIRAQSVIYLFSIGSYLILDLKYELTSIVGSEGAKCNLPIFNWLPLTSQLTTLP